LFSGIAQLLHLVQAAPTDDANGRSILFHLRDDLIGKIDKLKSR
jgi:hypothetical protein